MRKSVLILATLLALSSADAATVRAYKYYGALYATPKDLQAAVPNMQIERRKDAWRISYQGQILMMTDNSTKGTLSGESVNIGSPPRVVDSLNLISLEDIKNILGVMDLQPSLEKVLAKAEPTPAPKQAPLTLVYSAPSPVAPVQAPTTSTQEFVATQPEYSVYKSDTFSNFERILEGGGDVQIPSPTEGDFNRNIYAVCKTMVTSRLKAPLTAIFSGGSIIQYRDSAWGISITVDAQNSYGAMLRKQYHCFMRQQYGKLEIAVIP